MPALRTGIEMSTESRRAAVADGAERLELLIVETRFVSVQKTAALCVEDIGHLHGRPAHDAVGLRFNRDRGTTGGGVTCSCSSGFGAAWRWRRERWRYTVVCDKSA